MLILADYAGLSPKQPVNTFASGVDLNMYSRGMGTMGLPGIYHPAQDLQE